MAESSPKTLVVDARATTGARSRGVLTVVGGLETGRVLPIAQGPETTLGRAEACLYRFDDASVSGVHARVLCVVGSHMFVDNGSTNGSFVNDVRCTAPIALSDGDRIQLGSATFLRFSLVSEEEEVALCKVYHAALRDGLTGVFNRKHFDERLDAEIGYALRHGGELSLIMLDVDHFKNVNDTHGHLAGDAVLKAEAHVLGSGIRTEDFLARYGGEEFAIVARGIGVAAAMVFADRLRQRVGQTTVGFGATVLRVTVSAGVASLRCCGERHDKAALIGLADARLYKAKQAGRNRVVGAE